MIRLKGVHKSFGVRHILRGIDIHVEEGESMIILGGSGTGKSVSIRHVMGLLEPDQGDVLVGGVSMANANGKTRRQIRSRMGVLFQSGALINWLTVYENVALPLKELRLASDKEIHKSVMEKLEWMDLIPAKDTLPSDISGGMKKRAGVARALTTNPEIILYDEPTSGLDPVMSQTVNELQRRLQRELNVTQVTVTHDMNAAYYVGDRITFMYQGKVLMVGTPDEIRRADNPVIQQFINGRTTGPITDAETQQA